jgi:hypothetical protein
MVGNERDSVQALARSTCKRLTATLQDAKAFRNLLQRLIV